MTKFISQLGSIHTVVRRKPIASKVMAASADSFALTRAQPQEAR